MSPHESKRPAPKQLRIGSAAELFAALQSVDAGLEALLLEAIALKPAEALALGPHGQETLPALLAQRLALAAPGSARELLLVKALAALPGDRVALDLWPRFEREAEAELLAVIAGALQRLPVEWRQQHLSGWLRGPDEPRSRLAANLLADAPTPAVSVRTDQEDLPPARFSSEWLDEFHGPYRERAHLLWRSRAQELAPYFADLPPGTQRWLLGEVRGQREWLRPHLDAAVLLVLLQRFEPPEWALEHHDPRVREAAARRTGSPERWRSERDPGVQAAYVGRLRDSAALTDALHSCHWQVRAAASRAAVELGLVEPLRQALLSAPSEEVRAACVQGLIGLGDEAWLEDNLRERLNRLE